jgi:hypothetical protein
MNARATVAVLILVTLGCGGGAEPAPETKPKPEPKAAGSESGAGARPKREGPEPDHVMVAHVLISFQGTKTKATRSQYEAEKLAGDILAKARKGDDFNKLMRDYSDDPGEGVYGMANFKINPVAPEVERDGMVRAFGDVGFSLEVGEIGMAVYDPKKSPFGWHIIKRIK